MKNGSPVTKSASTSRWSKLAKAASISRSLVAVSDVDLQPETCAPPPAASFNFGSVIAIGRVHEQADRRGRRAPARAAVPAASPPAALTRTLTPVTLPPGRLRLATRPSLTGSSPVAKTIGIVVVAALAASAAGVLPPVDDHGHLAADQIGRQRRQPVVLALRPAIFDRDVAALDVAGSRSGPGGTRPRACANCGGMLAMRNPITGIAGCCARAASGHAAAAPPSSVMNSRRLIDHLVGARESARGIVKFVYRPT